MQWLRSRIARSPRGAVILGKGLFLVGSILILGAVFAPAGLRQAYPQYPDWLLPEGPVGFTVAALLVLAGMGLIVLAEDAVKRERAKRDQRF